NDDRRNLKHDLELQRLITESHILSESNSGLNPIGKTRLKTLDTRIDSLSIRSANARSGNKTDYYSLNPKSLLEIKQRKFNREKMSMKMRTGILSKQSERKRRSDSYAREAGIVLPVSSRSNSISISNTNSNSRRDRGLKIQAVGKFTRSGLKINKSDIARLS
ncbi:uncharacterized protein V1516DRAFT_609336, partial [Lipomyces oligophaga]|uniref:uncharacterized protein n=1 Tax=Lipomyces oligophaga TaxID=45792 RepID=UPI0034CE4B34